MNRKVLFFSEVNWDYLKQRHHFFTELYSNHHKVVYFGKIGLRYPNLRDVKLLLKKKHREKKVNFAVKNIVFSNILFLPPINFIFNLFNRKIKLKRLIRSLSIDCEYIIHFYQPTKLIIDFINLLRKNDFKFKVVYDCVQDYRYHPSTSKELIENEFELCELSTVILADSIVNYERLHPKFNDVLLIPPGVDSSHFSFSSQNLRNKSNGVTNIIYYGNIRQDLDLDLINNLADSNNFNVTLIGLLNLDKSSLSKNVSVLPSVDYQDLPKVLVKYDALLLPYSINNIFAEAIIPAKFYECLATGLPILSTRMESTKPYHHLLNIVDKNVDFDSIKIDKVSKEDLKLREDIVKSSSWQGRFNLFYNEI